MGATRQRGGGVRKPSVSKRKARPMSEEEKQATQELKNQQHELEALQITFYEIEAWIEKTTPILNRMTGELTKASDQFSKRRSLQQHNHRQQQQQQSPSSSLPPQHHLHHLHHHANPSSFTGTSTTTSTTTTPSQPMPVPMPSQSSPSVLHNTHGMAAASSAPAAAGASDSHCPMKWSMSFQPNNSMRLETNIKSVDELVEAVQQIRLLTNNEDETPIAVQRAAQAQRRRGRRRFRHRANLHGTNGLENDENPMDDDEMDFFDDDEDDYEEDDDDDDDDDLDQHAGAPLLSPVTSISMAAAWSGLEYWREAIRRRPRICLDNYKHHDMNLSCLTKDVSPNVMHYICHLYWDCLHPKFSSDWMTFWDRCDEPQRNQLCIDSGLAIVFMHGTRHHKDICANASDIAFYYYDRARENLMDYFDTPHCATLETLMNLSMFCILCKQHSQSRIYIGLAIRMMLEMGMHRRASLPSDNLVLRKKYLKFFTVLYYNDIQSSLYSGEPTQVNDNECDIDFYEIIELNNTLQQSKLTAYDDKILEKEAFFAHLMALAKIGKQTLDLINEYQRQLHPLPHMIKDDLPYRWAKRIQALEIELAQWYNRLPDHYRVHAEAKSPPTRFHQKPSHGEYPHTPMNAGDLRMQSALLLMLQYQMQWILLHKTFYNSATSRRCSPDISSAGSFTPSTPAMPSMGSSPSTPSSPVSKPSPCWQPSERKLWHRQCNSRSEAICLDAANRIVVLAESITQQFGWCVCQQFVSCIYQASTVFCRHAIDHNKAMARKRLHADAMLQRIVRVLAFSSVQYRGLPDDLTVSLMELLQQNGAVPANKENDNEQQYDPANLPPSSILRSEAMELDTNTTSSSSMSLSQDAIATLSSATMVDPRVADDDELAADDTTTTNGSYFSSQDAVAASLYMPSSPTTSPSPPLSTPPSRTVGSNVSTPIIPDSPIQPPPPNTLLHFIDTLPNSPLMYQQCLTQPRIRSSAKYRSLMAGESPTEAMLSIKMKDPVVDDSLAMEKTNAVSSSWRHKFSSPYVAAGNQRVI